MFSEFSELWQAMKGEPDAEREARLLTIKEQELRDEIEQLRWKLEVAKRTAEHHEETLENIREEFNNRWATETTEWKHSEAGKAFLKSWRVGHEKATKDHETIEGNQAKFETQLHAAKLKLMRLQGKE